MADAIKVLLVDDDEQTRAQLRYKLGFDSRFNVVGEAYDGRSALRSVEAEKPDVIVLDLVMPNMDGYHAIPQIQMSSPATKILIYTSAAVEPLVLLYKGADAVRRKQDVLDGEGMAQTIIDICERTNLYS